jgi:hypothetical protein
MTILLHACEVFGIFTGITILLAAVSRLTGHKRTLRAYLRRAAKEGYLHRVLVAFDQFWNVVLGGDPDETISSRAARWAVRSHRGFWFWRTVARAMIAWLDFIQPGHDLGARAGDLVRAEKVEQTEAASLHVQEDH